MGDADSTLLSNAAEDDSNLKSGIDEGFEVVTLESDYQVVNVFKFYINILINYIHPCGHLCN